MESTRPLEVVAAKCYLLGPYTYHAETLLLVQTRAKVEVMLIKYSTGDYCDVWLTHDSTAGALTFHVTLLIKLTVSVQ
jgi:hypothetical protein